MLLRHRAMLRLVLYIALNPERKSLDGAALVDTDVLRAGVLVQQHLRTLPRTQTLQMVYR